MVWPFDSQNKFNVNGKWCVVSGGSQGLGVEILKRLVRENAHVRIVARTESKLKAKVAELKQLQQTNDQVIDYVAADLSTYEGCEKAFEGIEHPDVVMCCAGSAKPGLFTDLTAEDLLQGIKLNYNTCLFFTHVAFKKMAHSPVSKKKHIVLFSSVVAFFPLIGYSQYSPLKAAIRTLADSLRQEGLPYNIHTTSVFPGSFDSEGFAEENLTKPQITKDIEGASVAISCRECSDVIFKQLQLGTSMVTTDTVGWVLNSLMLGHSPRNWWPIQALLLLLFALFAPILNIVINIDIMKYFNKERPLEKVQKSLDVKRAD